MKEDMLEVLIYLFENYLVEDAVYQSQQADLAAELEGAGFPSSEIDKAFAWLEGLLEICEQQSPADTDALDSLSFRSYTPDEQRRIPVEARSMLSRLVAIGMLDWQSREMVIDRVMALESADVELSHVKWVVLLVMSNQPDVDQIADWAEVLEAHELRPTLH